MKNWLALKNNSKLWNTFFVREQVVHAIRSYFYAGGFHEVEVPSVIAHPLAESYIEVFETTLLDRKRNKAKAYLSTSPEVAIKKLLVAGLPNCYCITKSFRNTETASRLHNPEFTILEWYRLGVNYQAIMEDCEQLVMSIHRSVNTQPFLTYQGRKIDLTPPWERLTAVEAFEKWVHISQAELFDYDSLRQIAAHKGYKIEKDTTWEQLYNQIFLNEVEPHLGDGKPTILYEFPASQAALAKTKTSDPRVAERFEFYIAGLELGDCYTELTDWKEQDARFKKEMEETKRLGKTAYVYDQEFIDALKMGLPECSGIAVGIDRLAMLFADVTDIGDVIFFPARDLF